MDLREQFEKEKDRTYWAEGCDYGNFNDEYVEWLEGKVEMAKGESLLKKYIEHVGQCEGVTFISKCNDGHSSDVNFSDKEIEILERLS